MITEDVYRLKKLNLINPTLLLAWECSHYGCGCIEAEMSLAKSASRLWAFLGWASLAIGLTATMFYFPNHRKTCIVLTLLVVGFFRYKQSQSLKSPFVRDVLALNEILADVGKPLSLDQVLASGDKRCRLHQDINTIRRDAELHLIKRMARCHYAENDRIIDHDWIEYQNDIFVQDHKLLVKFDLCPAESETYRIPPLYPSELNTVRC